MHTNTYILKTHTLILFIHGYLNIVEAVKENLKKILKISINIHLREQKALLVNSKYDRFMKIKSFESV